MKVFLENYNGVLDTIEDYLDEHGELTDNPHEADCFVLWQDVRGVCRDLAIQAKQIGKSVLVMQHGRGATRDYGPPNKFRLIADKIMVWGESERQRLHNYCIDDSRITVTGCPLLPRLKKEKSKREGKNILFMPIIAEKEEPENILVYAKLKIWESEKLIKSVYDNFDKLKRAWAWENNELREIKLPDGTIEQRLWRKDIRKNLPRWLTYGNGLLNVKLSGVHDVFQYQAPLIVTQQNDPQLVDGLTELLANTDVMVCIEEGTAQLLACAMDIPIIVVDIFRYGNYGGCANYDSTEKIRTKACYWIKDINKLGAMVDHALANSGELKGHRLEACRYEGGTDRGDPVANVISTIRDCLRAKEIVSV